MHFIYLFFPPNSHSKLINIKTFPISFHERFKYHANFTATYKICNNKKIKKKRFVTLWQQKYKLFTQSAWKLNWVEDFIFLFNKIFFVLVRVCFLFKQKGMNRF